MPKKVTIHEEDFERLLSMSESDAGFILHNLIRTLKGIEVVKRDNEYLDYFSENACAKMMRFAELSERQSENGKKGGGQFGNQNASKTSQKRTKTSQKRAKNEPKTSQKRAKTNPNTNTITNTITNNKDIYGSFENVYLTEDEFNKLKDKFPDYQDRIEALSYYISSKGKHYESHYATILNWARKESKEEKGIIIKPNQFNSGYVKRPDGDYDYEKMIKN